MSLDLDFGNWRAAWQIFDLTVDLTVNTDVDADIGRFDIPDVVISAQHEQLLVTVDLSCLQRYSGIAKLHNSRGKHVIRDELIVRPISQDSRSRLLRVDCVKKWGGNHDTSTSR